MQSDKPKRDLADFFKPYARHIPQPSIPQKRSSPSADQSERDPLESDTKIARLAPKTPVRTVSFKEVTPSPKPSVKRSIFPTKSDGALPIRSPQTLKSPSGATNSSTGNPRQRTLFETSSPPKPLRDTEVRVNPTTSFSFSDVSERSQSIIQDGKVVVVLNSDEDDSDSVQSLQDILGYRKADAQTSTGDGGDLSLGSSQDEDLDNETARIAILSKFTQGQSVPIVGKQKLREFYAKQRQLKFDLSMILDDHFEDLDAVEKARQARLESDSEAEDDQKLTETDKKLLADIVLNGGEDMDADDVNRVLSAMERTEALAGDRRFCFFGWKGMRDRRKHLRARLYPLQAVPNGLWTGEDDDDKRARAFMSGHMTEKATTGNLSEEVFTWVFWECLREQRPELQQAYMRTLQAGSSSFTRLHISASDVLQVFEMLDAAPEALQSHGPIAFKHRFVYEEATQNPAHLLVALELFQTIVLDLDMSALSKLSFILLRLSLDEMVMVDGRVAKMVQTLLETLLNHPDRDAQAHVYSQILEDSTHHLHDPVLQARLLSQIPATSDVAATLRKTLADVFLLGDSTLQRSTMTSRATLDALGKLVSDDPMFGITRKPQASPDDYAALTALITILDAAIGSGNPPNPQLSSTNITTGTAPLTVNYRREPSDKSIRIFNASVDALADSLHSIFVSIKDTGASHMRRTEAKDALQALEYRCLYSVRVGVRKKKHVFDIAGKTGPGSINGASKTTVGQIVGIDGDEYRDRERARAVMDRFLSKVGSQPPYQEPAEEQPPTTGDNTGTGNGNEGGNGIAGEGGMSVNTTSVGTVEKSI